MLRINAVIANNNVIDVVNQCISDLGLSLCYQSVNEVAGETLLVTDFGVGSISKILNSKNVSSKNYRINWLSQMGFFGQSGELASRYYSLNIEVLFGIRMNQVMHKKVNAVVSNGDSNDPALSFIRKAIDSLEFSDDSDGAMYRVQIGLDSHEFGKLNSGLQRLAQVAEMSGPNSDYYAIYLRQLSAEELCSIIEGSNTEIVWPFDDPADEQQPQLISQLSEDTLDDCWSFEGVGQLEDIGYWVGPEVSIAFETPVDDDTDQRDYGVITMEGLSIQTS